MKNCYKPMLICLGIAVAAILILPRFGIQIAGGSVLVGLLLIACCAVPMVIMMSGKSSGETMGGCCGDSNASESATRNKVSAQIIKADAPKPIDLHTKEFK